MTTAGLPLHWIDVEASLRRLGATVAVEPCDLFPAILRRLAIGRTTARPRRALPRRALPFCFGCNRHLVRTHRPFGPRPSR